MIRKIMFYFNFKKDVYNHLETLYQDINLLQSKLHTNTLMIKNHDLIDATVKLEPFLANNFHSRVFNVDQKNALVNKKRYIILFHHFDGFDDNAKYLYLYLLTPPPKKNTRKSRFLCRNILAH